MTAHCVLYVRVRTRGQESDDSEFHKAIKKAWPIAPVDVFNEPSFIAYVLSLHELADSQLAYNDHDLYDG